MRAERLSPFSWRPSTEGPDVRAGAFGVLLVARRPSLERDRELRLAVGEGALEFLSCGCVRRFRDSLRQTRDFLQQFDFGRCAIGILQNRECHPELVRRAEVFLQVQRFSGTWKLFEVTLCDRFANAALGEAAERHTDIVASRSLLSTAASPIRCAEVPS